MPPKKSKTGGFAPKEMVLAKMTGFPAWPSFVMPGEMIPGPIMKAKKKSTNTCVIFIPDGDFNWMNEKSLEPLTAEKLRTKISKIPKDKLKAKPKNKSGRTNNVVEALVAAENLDFDDFMDELNKNNENDELEDEDSKDSDENESEVKDMEAPNDDELDGEAGDENVDAHADTDTEARKQKTRATIDESTESNENGNRRSQERPLRSKRARSGTDTEDGDSDVSKLESKNGKKSSDNPRTMSEKDRQHQLWLCRIKLQRSLIQRNQPVTPKDPKDFPAPTVDELSVARIILHRLADFPVNVELLKETKIHKVLRCILKYDDLEYPDSFRLHEKCEELLEKWSDLIGSLKLEKQNRSRVGSSAPEDSEVSALDVKKDLGKVEV